MSVADERRDMEAARKLAADIFGAEAILPPTEKQKGYEVGFGIKDCFYDEWDGKCKILYSLPRRNFVDWQTHCMISAELLAKCKTTGDIYDVSDYAEWTDNKTQDMCKLPICERDEVLIRSKENDNSSDILGSLDNSSPVEYNEVSREKLVKLIENMESQLAEARRLLREKTVNSI